MICIARTLGAPLTVPTGSVMRKAMDGRGAVVVSVSREDEIVECLLVSTSNGFGNPCAARSIVFRRRAGRIEAGLSAPRPEQRG